MEKKDTTEQGNGILANLLVIAIFLILDILAIVVSIYEHSTGFTIVASIVGCAGLYALCHDILPSRSMA
jgi:hypothetical protein